MAAIQDLVLTFCPTMHSVRQKKLKLLMLVFAHLFSTLLSVSREIELWKQFYLSFRTRNAGASFNCRFFCQPKMTFLFFLTYNRLLSRGPWVRLENTPMSMPKQWL